MMQRAFELNRLRIELENRLKETETDWDIPKGDEEESRFHVLKVINEKSINEK